MTPAVLDDPAAIRQTTHGASAPPGPIVVASDGSAPAATALAVARLLRDRTGAVVRVVSVVEPMAAVVPAPVLLQAPVEGSRVEQRYRAVREQVDRILGTQPEVELDIEVGWPPEALARLVRDQDASFFVAGLVHHGRLERMARTETPLSVLRGAGAPVLALPWGVMREPRCVVIAVDLTSTSVVAAQRAAPLLQSAEQVYLVHVQEPVAPLAELPVVPEYDETAARQAIAEVARVLELPATAVVEPRVLVGHPAFEVADFAEYVHADLLVLGHRQRGVWGRLLHSSVAERAYRLANCGVLIVPSDGLGTGSPRTHAQDMITQSVPHRAQWPALLQAFSERNVGRRASVELFTVGLGAQSASVNFALVGVAYDPADDAVEIMLGDAEGRTRHVTHTVRQVSVVELSSYEGGADAALRLVHADGETLVTLTH